MRGGRNTHEIYFESTTVILVLITLGKYFETKAKDKTLQAIEKLIALVPENARLLRANEEVEINMKEGNKMKILIKVNDMSCQHCVKRVDATLNAIEGINDVVVSLEKGEASFTATDTVDINEAIAAVTEAGYPSSLQSE